MTENKNHSKQILKHSFCRQIAAIFDGNSSVFKEYYSLEIGVQKNVILYKLAQGRVHDYWITSTLPYITWCI